MVASVVLVDDTEAIRVAFRDLLIEAGYAVTSAARGFEVERIIDSLARDGHCPDLLVVDPVIDGVTGYDLIRQARQRFPGLLIVAISGGTRSVPADLALDLAKHSGADLCVAKPFRNPELVAIVGRLMAGRSEHRRTGT